MHDVSLIGIFVCFFLVLGISVPYIQNEFSINTVYIYDAQTGKMIEDYRNTDISEEMENIGESTDFTGLTMLKSIAGMFTFTFGQLPLFLDLIMFIPRILLYVLIYRQIRSGGG